jgi:hypothetical protein
MAITVTPITDLQPADPSGSVGLAAVNGSSSSYIRADAAPALSQAIAPAWTGQHTFSEARSIASATSAVLDDVNISAQTTTVTGTTTITTAQGFNKVSIYKPTYTDGSAVTVTVGATLYIEDAPTTAGLLTLTNKYPLWVDNGTVRFDGGLTVGGTGVEAAGTINASSGYRTNSAAPTTGTILQSDGSRFINTNIVWPTAGNIAGAVPVCNASNAYVAKVLGGLSSVTATVDQTATAETAHVIGTIVANTASIGTVFHIHASGNVDNGTTGITFTPHIRWGGTGGVSLLATPTFTASTTANTNRAYVLDAYVTIRTIGASGTAVAEMNYVEKSTSTTGVETIHTDNSGTTAVTIDTTANKDLDLTWALSANTGTPHIRTISGFVSVVKP